MYVQPNGSTTSLDRTVTQIRVVEPARVPATPSRTDAAAMNCLVAANSVPWHSHCAPLYRLLCIPVGSPRYLSPGPHPRLCPNCPGAEVVAPATLANRPVIQRFARYVVASAKAAFLLWGRCSPINVNTGGAVLLYRPRRNLRYPTAPRAQGGMPVAYATPPVGRVSVRLRGPEMATSRWIGPGAD